MVDIEEEEDTLKYIQHHLELAIDEMEYDKNYYSNFIEEIDGTLDKIKERLNEVEEIMLEEDKIENKLQNKEYIRSVKVR